MTPGADRGRIVLLPLGACGSLRFRPRVVSAAAGRRASAPQGRRRRRAALRSRCTHKRARSRGRPGLHLEGDGSRRARCDRDLPAHARCRAQPSAEESEECRLARSVRPHDGGDGAGFDVQGHVAQRQPASAMSSDVVEADHGAPHFATASGLSARRCDEDRSDQSGTRTIPVWSAAPGHRRI